MSIIYLPALAQIAILACCFFIVYWAKVEWAMGIYLSLPSWVSVFYIGRLNHVWLSLLTLAGATVVLWCRSRKIEIFPRGYAWIVFWMVFWWGWILFLLVTSQAPIWERYQIYVTFLCYSVFPVPMLLVIARDLKKLKSFATVYLLTTMLGGVFALSRLRAPLSYVIKDPLLLQFYGVKGGFHQEMQIHNYHTFAMAFAISFIFVIVLMELSKTLLEYLLFVGAAVFCVYFLFLANSKQAIGSAAIVGGLLVLWIMGRAGTGARFRAILMMSAAGLTAVLIYLARPELILRNYKTLSEAFNVMENRGFYWRQGLELFAESPVWGDRFFYGTSMGHNYFISTLTNQGVVGFFFVIGFLVFLSLQTKGIIHGSGDREVALWRAGVLGMVMVSFAAAQVSGSSVTSWPIYWGAALLWRLRIRSGISSERATPPRPKTVAVPGHRWPARSARASSEDVAMLLDESAWERHIGQSQVR